MPTQLNACQRHAVALLAACRPLSHVAQDCGVCEATSVHGARATRPQTTDGFTRVVNRPACLERCESQSPFGNRQSAFVDSHTPNNHCECNIRHSLAGEPPALHTHLRVRQNDNFAAAFTNRCENNVNEKDATAETPQNPLIFDHSPTHLFDLRDASDDSRPPSKPIIYYHARATFRLLPPAASLLPSAFCPFSILRTYVSTMGEKVLTFAP